jgi:tRNA(Arg) A34 adenosine deaminase TadA
MHLDQHLTILGGWRNVPAMTTGIADLVHDKDFMELAFRQAEAAASRNEVPIGAVLVDSASGQVLGADHNRVEELHDPTAHAEMLVIRAVAMGRSEKRLPLADLYVTLEPCAMCAAAVSLARLRRLVFAAADPKGGGVEHGARVFSQPTCHHRPVIFGGLDETRSARLLKAFFARMRK